MGSVVKMISDVSIPVDSLLNRGNVSSQPFDNALVEKSNGPPSSDPKSGISTPSACF